jgi:hypothetical protein
MILKKMMTFKYKPILTLVAGLFIEAEDRTIFVKRISEKNLKKSAVLVL